MFTFLLVVQAIIAAALVTVILMQRSEGGGLGVGGSPSGLMSARGVADFLTRTTAVLAALFVILSIVLAAVAVGATSGREIDTTLDRRQPVGPAPVQPADPLAGAAGGAVNPPMATQKAPPANTVADPLAGAAEE